MSKELKKLYRKILSASLSVVIMCTSIFAYNFFDNGADTALGAEKVTIKTVDNMSNLKLYADYYTGGYGSPMKMTSDGRYCYCVEMRKSSPSSSGQDYTTLNTDVGSYYNDTVKDGIKAILDNGFPNNKNFYGTANDKEAYWATSMAIHIWLTHNGYDNVTDNSTYISRFNFNNLDTYIKNGRTEELYTKNPESKRAFIACCKLLKDVVNNNIKNPSILAALTNSKIVGNNYILTYKITVKDVNGWDIRANKFYSKASFSKVSGTTNDTVTVTVPINSTTAGNSYPFWVRGYLNGSQSIDNFYLASPTNNAQTMLYYKLNRADETAISINATVPAMGKLQIIKKDSSTDVVLANAVFSLYTDSKCTEASKVNTAKTDNNGKIIFSNLIPGTYYLKENQAPAGYLLDATNNGVVKISVVSNKTSTVTIKDNYAVGEIEITKIDSETKQTLQGAIFELYARENIVSPDGKTVLYAKNNLVKTLNATDNKGVVTTGEIPLGKYYVVEKTAPVGYYKNDNKISIDVTYANQKVPVVVSEKTIANDYQYGKIVITKTDSENGKLLAGAVFDIYAKNDIVSPVDNSTVLFPKDSLVLTSAETDNNGQVVIEKLHLGEYYIKEVEAPIGYRISDEVVDYAFEYQGQDVQFIPVTTSYKNDEQRVSVQIIKKDAETGNPVPISDAKFEIVSADTNQVIETVTTNEQGIATSGIIKYGTTGAYYIREIIAPYGYELSNEEIPFIINDETDKAGLITIEYSDTSIKGVIKVEKTGEVLTDYVDGKFVYNEAPLRDVVLGIYAKEDIYSADRSTVVYNRDSLIEEITTKEDGVAYSKELPFGNYYIKELKAPDGYSLDNSTYDATIDMVNNYDTDEFNNKTVVIDTVSLFNKLQDIDLSVIKKDSETNKPLTNVEFSLVANDDIYSIGGMLLVKAGTVLETKKTDENGNLKFDTDLPSNIYACGTTSEIEIKETREDVEKYEDENDVEVLEEIVETTDSSLGMYYVQEAKGLENYYTKNEIQYIKGNNDGNTDAVKIELTYFNDISKIIISKQDITSSKELAGVTLQILDKNGNIVKEWITTNEPTQIEGLDIGVEYTLKELKPIDGYILAEDIRFTIKDDKNTIETVVMYDDYTKVKVNKADSNNLPVKDAILGLYDSKGNEVAKWKTDETGQKAIDRLPVGTYTLKELSVPYGYEKADDMTIKIDNTGDVQSYTMIDEIGVVPLYEDIPLAAPQTGDNNPLLIYIICFIGFFLFGLVGFKKLK